MTSKAVVEKDTAMTQNGGSPHSHKHSHNHDHDDHDEHEHHQGLEIADLARIVLVALAAAAVWFHWFQRWEPFANFSLVAILATLIGGYPIFKEAVENIFERKMTMELSMTIALLAALAIREFFTTLVITLFVLVAEVLEGLTVGRGRKAIREMIDFLPRTANRVSDGQVEEIEIDKLLVGDVVLAKPGTRIPVDGEVVDGHSFVDQASITGESMPVEKSAGMEVYAGTINQSGALHIRTARIGSDTTFGKIIEAVERAEHSKAPIQKTADRLAGYLVYFAIAAALLTFFITHNIRSTISVIIVAGACGIAAGTPLAILGAIGRAARQGSIIKGGLYLEVLGSVDTVLLDKTGTLTFGMPTIRRIQPAAESISEDGILLAAAIAESRSEHPLAHAILKSAREKRLVIPEPESFEYKPGRGVIASSSNNGNRQNIVVGNRALLEEQGMTIPDAVNGSGSAVSEVLVAEGNTFLGSIHIADQLRPESVAAMRALKSMGIETVLLTGDAASVANSVGETLGVKSVHAELLPEQKLQHVARLVREGHVVAMIGDGINDAPALTEASVGIAMGSGTDVARESADIVLIGNDLSKFVETLRIARKCKGIIMQNFYGTLIVDGIGVGMAAFGLLNPLLAAFIHVSSELAFILNSTRLLPSMSSSGKTGAQGAAPS
ncbi:MAG TPA: cation-translocating P-type ATPase [Terriglobales bacterium]|nr:cation-translocating P-type ATPase [Terriglobales bacterium]